MEAIKAYYIDPEKTKNEWIERNEIPKQLVKRFEEFNAPVLEACKILHDSGSTMDTKIYRPLKAKNEEHWEKLNSAANELNSYDHKRDLRGKHLLKIIRKWDATENDAGKLLRKVKHAAKIIDETPKKSPKDNTSTEESNKALAKIEQLEAEVKSLTKRAEQANQRAENNARRLEQVEKSGSQSYERQNKQQNWSNSTEPKTTEAVKLEKQGQQIEQIDVQTRIDHLEAALIHTNELINQAEWRNQQNENRLQQVEKDRQQDCEDRHKHKNAEETKPSHESTKESSNDKQYENKNTMSSGTIESNPSNEKYDTRSKKPSTGTKTVALASQKLNGETVALTSQKWNGKCPDNKNIMTTIEHDPRNEPQPNGKKNNTRKDTMIERNSNEPSIGSAILAFIQNPRTKNDERSNATNDAREQAIATVPTTTEFFPQERVTKL